MPFGNKNNLNHKGSNNFSIIHLDSQSEMTPRLRGQFVLDSVTIWRRFP